MLLRISCLTAPFLVGVALHAQKAPQPSNATPGVAKAAASLTLRSIGPALAGGRIADVAVHPVLKSTWYVAAGSGGL